MNKTKWFTYEKYDRTSLCYINCKLICNTGPYFAGATFPYIKVNDELKEISFIKSFSPPVFEKYRLYLTVGEKIEQEPKRNYE